MHTFSLVNCKIDYLKSVMKETIPLPVLSETLELGARDVRKDKDALFISMSIF